MPIGWLTELLQAGTPTYDRIIDAFGEQILGPIGEIDRKKLGQIVFSDADKRLQLNALMHPDVGAEILRRIFELEQILVERHSHRGCGADGRDGRIQNVSIG